MSLKERETQIFDLLEGTLTEPEKTALLRHFEECSDCRKAFREAQAGMKAFAGLGIKETVDLIPRVMPKIHGQPSPGKGFPWISFVVGGALVAFLIAGVVRFGSPVTSGPPVEKAEPTPVPSVSPKPASPTPETARPPVIAIVPDGIKVKSVQTHGDWGAIAPPSEEEVAAKSVFNTPDKGALSLTDSRGDELCLLPSSELHTSENGFFLARGAVWCEVQSRSKGGEMEIRTRDARILVIGTAFGVVNGKDSTTVEVVEGCVTVIASQGEPVQLLPGNLAEIVGGHISTRSQVPSDVDFWKPWIPKSQNGQAGGAVLGNATGSPIIDRPVPSTDPGENATEAATLSTPEPGLASHSGQVGSSSRPTTILKGHPIKFD